ncbi:MAG: hypothetical protein QNJ42_11550 [Crocosphaera sp.]|nr:hypothetical protein [Crocosphaera sp.]
MSRIAINNLNRVKSQDIITLEQKELQFIQGGGKFGDFLRKVFGGSKNEQTVNVTVNCCCKDGDG